MDPRLTRLYRREFHLGKSERITVHGQPRNARVRSRSADGASLLGCVDQCSEALEGLYDLFSLSGSNVPQGIGERRKQSLRCVSSVPCDLVSNGDPADAAIIGVRVPTHESSARQPIYDARHRAVREVQPRAEIFQTQWPAVEEHLESPNLRPRQPTSGDVSMHPSVHRPVKRADLSGNLEGIL